MMRIALCTSFMQGEIWTERLLTAFPNAVVNECRSVDALINCCCMTAFDAVLIALDGNVGVVAVMRIREKFRHQHIIWISDSLEDGMLGYQYQVASVLPNTATIQQLHDALQWCLENKL